MFDDLISGLLGNQGQRVNDYATTQVDVPEYSRNTDTPTTNRSIKDFIPKIRGSIGELFEPTRIEGGPSEEKKKKSEEETKRRFEEAGFVQNEAGEWVRPGQENVLGQSERVSPTTQDYTNAGLEAQIGQDFLNYLENNIFPQTREYGIPDQLVASQVALESARASSPAAVNQNNPFGLGPGITYQSLDDAIRDYDMTLRSIIAYNKGMLDKKHTQPQNFSYSDYTPEDLAWTLMFTDLEDRRAQPGNPLYGDPNASSYRYEAHSDIPDYVSLLKKQPEWQYFGGN